jgi:hypothetical protein
MSSSSPQLWIDNELCHPKSATPSAATTLHPAVAPGITVALRAVPWYDAARYPGCLLSPSSTAPLF